MASNKDSARLAIVPFPLVVLSCIYGDALILKVNSVYDVKNCHYSCKHIIAVVLQFNLVNLSKRYCFIY